MIVDSHCHLDFPSLYDQLDDVVNRAEINQVKYLLTICTTLQTFERIKLIVDKYKNIYGTFGIHPHETKNFSNINERLILEYKNKHKKIIGIGETGLDYYYNHSDKEIQKKVFIEHIKAASKLNIPLIVHSRNADADTYDILQSEKKNSKLNILMHCFTGTTDFAKKLLNLDCYFSFSGIITFKNSQDLLKTASFIPSEKLLVETDSPYLAPLPFRGKVNEPSYIIQTIKKLSEVKKINNDDMIKITSNNFFKIFNIDEN